MEILVENLGPIKAGEIDLAKDLIILTGPNNTGKSYVAYLIYGILKIGKTSGEVKTRVLTFCNQKYADELGNETDLKKAVLDNYEFLLNIINEFILKQIPQIFASKNVNPSVKIQEKKIPTGKITINNQLINSADIPNAFFIFYFLKMFLPNSIIFFPAERAAINMLAKEIIRNKASERDDIAKKLLAGEELETIVFAAKQNNLLPRYPLAISDYLYFISDLDYISKNDSDFADFADEIEKKLLQGQVFISDYGDIKFTPQNGQQALDIHLSSSLVKSLSGLVLYFRHLAQEGDVIIMDEPELNLHPDNQRIVAKIFAKAVNRGFKVILSTHSNYLIKEFNNLIMLHNASETDIKEFGYDKTVTLDKEKISAYFFSNNTMESIEVSDTGLSVKTIDATIDSLDNTMENIYYRFFESA